MLGDMWYEGKRDINWGKKRPRTEARGEEMQWGMDKQNIMTYMYEIIIKVP